MSNGQPPPIVEPSLMNARRPIFARDASIGAGLAVILDLSGLNSRSLVAVFVRSSAAAIFTVEGSLTPGAAGFRVCDTIEFGAAGQDVVYYNNAFPYVRVRTESPNNNEIDISAAR